MADTEQQQDEGVIRIDDDVYSTIAAAVTEKVSGVAGMNPTLVNDFTNRLGLGGATQGVKIQHVSEDAVAVSVYITVTYGYRIPDIALRLQGQVKSAIEEMTGTQVGSVNVFVQEIVFGDNQASAEMKG